MESYNTYCIFGVRGVCVNVCINSCPFWLWSSIQLCGYYHIFKKIYFPIDGHWAVLSLFCFGCYTYIDSYMYLYKDTYLDFSWVNT